jgi:hypothetical protein
MHGGASTGAKTAAGQERIRKAHWKTGHFSAERLAQRRMARETVREFRTLLVSVNEISTGGKTCNCKS